MKMLFLMIIALTLLFSGCETRSISNSGYQHSSYWGAPNKGMYSGELSEFDILGVADQQNFDERDIGALLADSVRPKPQKGTQLLVIQSGAMIPDTEMINTLKPHFGVGSFSGIPPKEKEGFSKSLRLRAAQGGFPMLFCYWGTLESAVEDREGKVLSWVPIIGTVIPDEKQYMRIKLKGILVDVASGNWQMLTVESEAQATTSNQFYREESDQKQVISLKKSGYAALVEKLLAL